MTIGTPAAMLFNRGLDVPLLKRSSLKGAKELSRLGSLAYPSLQGGRVQLVSVLVAVVCISCGMLHPLATEASKSAQISICTMHRDIGLECAVEASRRVMPFHAVSLTVLAELFSVVALFVAVAAEIGSARAALGHVLDPRALIQLGPIGLFYGLGDFLQTVACNSASAPVVVVVGQSKLMLAALLSRLLIRSRQPTNWFRLAVISLAATASTDIGAGVVVSERSAELYGALLAFLKAVLSSLGAVLSERHFKGALDSFWVTSCRVQLMMLCTSVTLLPWMGWGSRDAPLSDFILGGPEPLCSELVSSSEGWIEDSRTCVDRSGWDMMTVLAALAIALNGTSTGLTLKFLSAVSKSVCNAVAAGLFYIAYVLLGYRPFSLAQASVMAIVIMSSYEYAGEKAQQKGDGKTALPS